jgi:dephospho-CoA kinase
MSEDSPRGEHRAVRIGITGPIGCGKSTVARWLGERPDVVVVDADLVAREVLDPGEPALAAVIERFGTAFLRPDGSLDRAALGRHVFADANALRDLEAIVHPAVRPRILVAIAAADAAGASAIVIEAIKLVEGGLATACDEVWLVTCDREAQLARLVDRGTSLEDAAQRIAAQGDIKARIKPVATRTIDTSGDPAVTKELVLEAVEATVEGHRRIDAGRGVDAKPEFDAGLD